MLGLCLVNTCNISIDLECLYYHEILDLNWFIFLLGNFLYKKQSSIIRVNISNGKTRNGFCDISYQVLKTWKLRQFRVTRCILFNCSFWVSTAHTKVILTSDMCSIWVRMRCLKDDIWLMTLIDLTILLLSGCMNRLRWAFNTKSTNVLLNVQQQDFYDPSFFFCKWGTSPPFYAWWWSKFAKQITNKTLSATS